MAIGNYIHAHYEHYEKFGLNTKDSGIKDSPNPSAIFSDHHRQMKNLLAKEKGRFGNKVSKTDIETQLNFYFGAKNGNQQLSGDITQQDLQTMEQAIAEYLGPKLSKVSIDTTKLSSAVSQNLDADILNWKNEADETIQERLRSATKNSVGSSGSAYKKAIQTRINLLRDIRDRMGRSPTQQATQLYQEINELSRQWGYILRTLNTNSSSTIDLRIDKNKSFVEQLNKVMSKLLVGSSTLHGEYAECVVVATNFAANARAAKETRTLLKQDFIDALRRGVQGQARSNKGLVSMHFDGDLVDLSEVTKGTVYSSPKMVDAEGNYFSTRSTQDKVDVTIEVNGFDVNASVKNYDMSNTKFNVHLLSGSSVLMLAQEYENFMNHYLNNVSTHEDKEAPQSIVNDAHTAMKLTILLKALQGGLSSNKGLTSKADVFIINDSSKGGFSVYFIDEILDRVAQNLNLLETGDYDSLNRLDNGYIGTKPEDASARMRISKLLAQLHAMKLDVSIDKSVFSGL